MVCLIRLHLVYASEICYVRKTQEDVIAYMMYKTELYISKYDESMVCLIRLHLVCASDIYITRR